MATAPVKPQPLHNFPLSLKWGQTTAISAANHHPHRSNSSRSPVAESETESENEPATRPPAPTPPPRVGSRSARLHRMSFTSCPTILPKAEKTSPEKRATTAATVVLENNGKSQKQAVALDGNNGGAQSEGEEEAKRRKDEEEGGNLRPWKLRPRKGILKEAAAANEHKERESNGFQAQQKSMRLRGSAENGGGSGGLGNGEVVEKKGKRKFWIALSREEIEEDIFIMTGSRPARRPKKRPKNVQKAIDNVFPGLWLVGTTADYYRLADNAAKR